MCATDFDPAAMFCQKTVRARKPWTCVECGLPIPTGRHYVKTTMVSERGNRPTVDEAHPECDALADFIRDQICGPIGKERHGVILIGGLGEEIENLGEYMAGTGPGRTLIGADVDDDGEPVGDAGPVKPLVEELWAIATAQYRTAVST